MTTRWKQKFCVTLAIIAVISLLLMLILLWSAVSNGMLSTNSRSSISVQETNLPTRSTEPPRRQSDWNDMSTTESANKTEFDEYVYEEFVKPSKVHHLPLHTDDLLYESKRNNSITEDFIYSHRKTGNYKSKSSRIWDPHPEYTINAFGHHMHLMLYQDASFIPSTFKVTNDYGNHTEIHEDNDSPGCHYKGHVLDDETSIVAVSLCNGMTGLIKTSYGSFFIQPDKSANTQGDGDILHRIWRQPKNPKHVDMERPLGRGCQLHDHTQDSNGIDFDSHFVRNVSHKRRKRDTYGAHGYTLEVLIAVDNKMLAFHKEEINSYVLTLMSIVSNIFSDASIGNSINVAVVDIWKIRQGLHLKYIDQGVYATDLLKEFCNYINDTSHHQRYRFDTAILLTREQICRNATETRCDTLGLAELGTVCKGHSCSLVQDNGLSAAFTIAHELGHILNMPHDDDKKCYHFKKDGKPMLNIMSSTMGNEIHPWSWSDCSRHYVTEFLESENIYCMENSPDTPYNINAKKLPGENYNLDQQCELIHGEDARCCNEKVKNEEECGRLWCQVNGADDCRSINLPWADGTPCRDRYHWCQKGECVHRDRRKLEPIHGGWGSWTSYTPCSRSCGSGVQESQRECNQPVPQNGGRYCRGDRKRYRSCNIHDCPENELDFREMQCAAYNNQNLDIQGIEKSVRWIPKYGVSVSAKDECTLYCRIENSSSYFKLADKVIDGTTCSFDSHNRCVNGVCRSSGCDNQLYSPAQLDRCGVCMGNNDTCTEVIGYVYKSDVLGEKASKANSYYDVIRIPKGASNIRITQPGYTETNYIVLLDDEGRYLLNGPLNGAVVISIFKRTFAYAGVTFEYSGIQSPLEQVNTTYSRKITRDLVVQILSLHLENQTNHREVLLTYTYTISRDPTSRGYRRHLPASKDTFKWEWDDWSPCDSICQGQRFRNAVCVNVETGQKVLSAHCDSNLKSNGPLYQACNLECDLMVNVESTSECSETCGKVGTREKRYACIQKNLITNLSQYIDPAYCLTKVENMPKYEECREACWSYTEWSQCSRTCATGSQKRSVVCKFEDTIVNESECNLAKKENFREVIRPCNTDPCPDWAYGEETPCSVTCGVGQRTTAIYCMHNNEIVDKFRCDGTELHPIIIKCTMPPCPEKRVISIPRRTLRPSTQQSWNNPSHDSRSRDTIYSSKHVEHIGDAWVTGHWGECDDNCERSRQVYCKNTSRPTNCPESTKPVSTIKCCSIKYVQKWSQCSVDCGIGTKEKLFICARVIYPDNPGGKVIKTPVDIKKCQSINKPKPKLLKKNCRNVCTWTMGEWTRCSSNRTIEYSTRSFKCTTKKNRTVSNKYCDENKIPLAKRKCPSSRHYKVELSNCTCDGHRKRKVMCYDGAKRIPCDRRHKLKKEKCQPPPECDRRSCYDVKNALRTTHDGEYTMNVKHKLVKIYCHNMTTRPSEYITLNSTENFSIYYAKSSKDPLTCPGLQRDEFQNEKIQAGSTRFKKIRLDIQSVQVIEDDYTFAESNGIPQKYGSAGDCYNRNQKCPQGFFSINLAGTGFRIARTTDWSTSGGYTSMKYSRELKPPYTIVQAFCGGYCGNCFISKKTNLGLDVI